MKSAVKNTITVALITFGILLFWEVGLRIFAPQIGQDIYSNGINMNILDPELGYRLAPNAMAIHLNREFYPDYKIGYRVNSQGFRDHATYKRDKPRDTVRILLLGDSFTFGIGNRYSRIWPVVLENTLKQRGYSVEVIKAGIYGYDTRLEVLHLEKIYYDYRPDIVVINFLPNDLFTNLPFVLEADELKESNRWVRQVSDEFTEAKISFFHVVTLAKRALLSIDSLYSSLYMLTGRGAFYDGESEVREEAIEVTKGLFMEGLDFLRETPTSLVVLSTPQNFQVVNTKEEVDVGYIDRELGAFAIQQGFPWIATREILTEVYKEGGEDLYFRLDGHLNNLGNQVVGEYFADKLEKMLQQFWWKQHRTERESLLSRSAG